jgi:hypothetical protein
MRIEVPISGGIDEQMRSALSELRAVGGMQQWLRCRFSFQVAYRLVESGLITIDDAPVSGASVQLTWEGWRVSRDG